MSVPEIFSTTLMVAKVMVGNGFAPGMELGKNGQGIRTLIQVIGQSHTTSLGYHGTGPHA